MALNRAGAIRDRRHRDCQSLTGSVLKPLVVLGDRFWLSYELWREVRKF